MGDRIKVQNYLVNMKQASKSKSTYIIFSADHNKLWNILQEMGIPDHLT